ncbi:MAG: hypothetical protein GOVbin4551_17 [Prokaryotic dsDNA virus sp.]|nr:MAG: hypothetical protein GOVbin4551_17 [Prokaryotic dsDNA virus sp.]|tara:strand:- start:468 stop:1148 length:681 start_codon:yes stop_codon:yes gene_type:complete
MNELDYIPYKYKNGIRYIFIDDEWVSEDTSVFLTRMKEAEDVNWLDIERAEQELPVFDDCLKDRRNLRAALEGIAAGGKMLLVTSKAGFLSWNEFESNALQKCKVAKKLYLLAKDERHLRKLNAAEDALHERAVEGVDEPMVNHLGQIVGYKKKYSDRLLEVQLKALDPDKYSDKKDVNVKGLVLNVDMGLRSDKEIKNEKVFNGFQTVDIEELTTEEESNSENSN